MTTTSYTTRSAWQKGTISFGSFAEDQWLFDCWHSIYYIDESFSLDFRSSLIQQFSDRDLDFGIDVPEEISLDPIEFID
ncbi:MAG: hypothetical protein R2827_01915 [Bdellovibrionales bacterium]